MLVIDNMLVISRGLGGPPKIVSRTIYKRSVHKIFFFKARKKYVIGFRWLVKHQHGKGKKARILRVD